MKSRSGDGEVFGKRNGSDFRFPDVHSVQLEHCFAHAAREASGAGGLEERGGERAAAKAVRVRIGAAEEVWYNKKRLLRCFHDTKRSPSALIWKKLHCWGSFTLAIRHESSAF